MVCKTKTPSKRASASTFCLIDRKMAGAFGLEKAAIAGIADERFVAPLQSAGKAIEDGLTLGRVALCLLLVAAEDIAPSANDNRLGAIIDLVPAPGHGQWHKRRWIAEHDLAHQPERSRVPRM